MNNTYKVVWNASLGAWNVASEIAGSRGKTKSSKAARAYVLASIVGVSALAGALNTADAAVQQTLTDYYYAFMGNNPVFLNHKENIAYMGQMAYGNSAKVAKEYGITFGGWSESLGTSSSAFGHKANALADFSTAIGASSVASSVSSTAVGARNVVTSKFGVGLGADNKVDGLYSVGIGHQIGITADRGIAMGTAAKVTGSDGIAIGTTAAANHVNSVAIGRGSVTTADNTVSFGKAGATGLRLTNIADGLELTDAVSLGQMNSRLLNLDGAEITNIINKINNNTTTAVGLVQQAADKTITIAANKDGNVVSLKGTAGNRKLSDLADGTSATDATNFKQLSEVKDLAQSAKDGLNGVPGKDGVNANVASVADALNMTQNPTTLAYNEPAYKVGKTAAGNSVQSALDTVNSMVFGDSTNPTAPSISNNMTVLANALNVGGDQTVGFTAPEYTVNNKKATTVKAGFALVDEAINGVNGQNGLSANVASVADALNMKKNAAGGYDQPVYTIGGEAAGSTVQAALNKVNDKLGTINPNAVSYSDDTKTLIMLGGPAAPTTIRNVKDGVDASDAVNMAQYTALKTVVDANQNPLTNDINLKYLKVKASNATEAIVGSSSVSVGGNARSAGSSVAIGQNANASGFNSVAIGSESLATAGTVSVGNRTLKRKVTNVANGEDGTDVATINQLNELKDKLGATRSLFENLSTEVATASARSVLSLGLQPYALGINELFAGNDILSPGVVATAKGDGGIALGSDANADSAGSTAIGSGAKAIGISSVSVGQDASASGTNATAIGASSIAEGDKSLAMGIASEAKGAGSLSLGSSSYSEGASSIAIGNADAVGADSIAIGNFSKSLSAGGIALGANSLADKFDVTAIGSSAKATGEKTSAFGAYANASAKEAVAIGYGAKATANGGVALGFGSIASLQDTVSVGKSATDNNGTALLRKIVNVANGSETNDAVNFGQLKAVDDKTKLAENAVQYDPTSNKTKIMLSGTTISNLKASALTELGTEAVTTAQLWKLDKAISDINGAIAPSDPTAPTLYKSVQYTDQNRTEVKLAGSGAKITNLLAGAVDNDAVNFKQLSDVKAIADAAKNGLNGADGKSGITAEVGKIAAALNMTKNSSGDFNAPSYGVAGQTSTTVNDALVALDTKINNYTPTNAVQYKDGTKTEINLAGSGAKITNLIDGTAAKDAVNKGQLEVVRDLAQKATDGLAGTNGKPGLNTVSTSVVAVASALNMNGTEAGGFTAPNYNVNSQSVNNVQSALTLLNNRITSTADNAVQYTSTSKNRIELGSVGTPTTITNLADGVGNSDAVNKKQLNAVELLAKNAADGLAGTNGKPGLNTVSTSVAAVANALNMNGTEAGGFTAPNYNVNSQSVNNVQSALTLLNNRITSTAGNAVQYTNDSKNRIELGSGSTTATITNLADGVGNSDAVNKKQLNAVELLAKNAADGLAGTNGKPGLNTVSTSVAAVANALNMNGNEASGFTAPNYNVNSQSVNNVQSALTLLDAKITSASGDGVQYAAGSNKGTIQLAGVGGTTITNLKDSTLAPNGNGAVTTGQLYTTNTNVGALDTRTTTIEGNITNISNGTIGLVKQANSSSTITVASDKGGSEVNFSGNGQKRKLTGIADSIIEVNGSNAVTTGQLSTTNTRVDTLEGVIGIGGGTGGPSIGDLARNSVQYDNATTKDKITLGKAGTQTTITNLKAGVADFDAVNMAQYNLLASTVGNVQMSNGDINLKYLKVTTGSNTAAIAGTKSISIGGNASTYGSSNAIAIGENASAKGYNSVAIGSESLATAGTVSVGNRTLKRKVTNVANGEDGTDVATINQLNELKDKLGSASRSLFENLSAEIATVSARSTLSLGLQPYALGINELFAGNDILSPGVIATAKGDGGTALGSNANADSAGSTAIGTGAQAIGVSSVSVGQDAMASGMNATAIGASSIAEGDKSLAMGIGSEAKGAGSLSLGSSSYSEGSSSIAIGNADAVGADSIAIGNFSKTVLGGAVALGANSEVSKFDGTAIGTSAKATGEKTSAFGAYANATAKEALAIGYGAKATANGGVALGYGSIASLQDTVSVGKSAADNNGTALLRKIVNVANGSEATDVATYGQLKEVKDSVTSGGALGVAYTDDQFGIVALKGGATGTTITNLKAGTGDGDAVNNKQLKDVLAVANEARDGLNGSATKAGLSVVSGSVDAVAAALSMTGDSLTGWKAPSYIVDGKTVTTVEAALTALDKKTGASAGTNDANVTKIATALGMTGTAAGGLGDPIYSVAGVNGGADAKPTTIQGAISAIDSNIASVNANVKAVVDGINGTPGKAGISTNVEAIAVALNMNGDAVTGWTAPEYEVNGGKFANVQLALTELDSKTGASATTNDANVTKIATALGMTGTVAGGLDDPIYIVAGLNGGADAKPTTIQGAISAIDSNIASVNANVKAAVDGINGTPGKAGISENVATIAAALNMGGDAVTGWTAPKYTVDGVDFTDVGAALTKLDNKVGTGGGSNNLGGLFAGNDNLSPGVVATAKGDGAIALGSKANADVAGSTAIGSGAQAIGISSVSVGQDASVSGMNGTAIGSFSSAEGDNSLAMGKSSEAKGTGSLSLGSSSYSEGTSSIAIGNADAIGANSIAMGNGAKSLMAGAIAIGDNSMAEKFDGTAIGTSSKATGDKTSAFGAYANATAKEAVAIGYGAKATANGGVALGFGSIASLQDTVSVGKSAADNNGTALLRKIVNVANGSEATDVATYGQLKEVADSVITGGTLGVAYDTTAFERVNLKGTNGTMIKNLKAGVDATDAVNKAQLDDVAASVAAGGELSVGYTDKTFSTVALRGGAAGTTITNLKAGVNATDAVNKTQLDIVSSLAQSAKDGLDGTPGKAGISENVATIATALNMKGDAATGWKAPSYTVQGQTVNNVQAGFDSMAVSIAAGGELSVGYTDKTFSTVALKGGATGTTIKNLNAGVDAMDAVNKGQLDVVSSLAQSAKDGLDGIPGQAGIKTNVGAIALALNMNGDATSGWTAPSYTVQGETVNSVQAALNVLSRPSNPGGDISYDDETYTSITFRGQPNGTVLKNVAAGIEDKDATNVSQLKVIAEALGGGVDDQGVVTTKTYNVSGKDNLNLAAAMDVLLKDAAIVDAVVYDRPNNRVTLNAVDGFGRAVTGGTLVTNVANGAINATSLDATNGSQMFEIQTQVTNITNVINGTDPKGFIQQSADKTLTVGKDVAGTALNISGISGDRTISGVKEGVLDNDAATVGQVKKIVGSAGGSIASNGKDGKPGKDAVASGNGSTAIGKDSIASGDNSVAIGNGSIADRPNTLSVGSEGNERIISNVAPGVLGTDAVNLNQLNNGLNTLDQKLSKDIQAVRRDVVENRKAASGGIASAMAMSTLPQAYTPGSSLASASVGGYGDRSALAIGISNISKDGKWIFNAKGSANTAGKVGGAIGIGYQW